MLFLFDTFASFLESIRGRLNNLSTSQPCKILNVASSNLPPWASNIVEQAASWIRCPPQPASFQDKILYLLTEYLTTSTTTAAILLISVTFLFYRHLMGDRRSFGYYNGRGSPFTSHLAENAPRNLSGHFEYIGDDHDLYTHRQSVANAADYPEIDDQDPNAPDRVHIRYMASAFPIDFPAYSINEEKTYVEDLRRKVADALRVDSRRIRLIYKGKDLKRNRVPLKKYRMKQNSEVTAVYTERPVDYYGNDSNSESGSERDSARETYANPRRQTRPRALSSVRLRSDDQVPVVRSNGGTYLSPNGHIPSTSERSHRQSLRPSDRPDRDSLRPPEHRESLRPTDRPERHESLRPDDGRGRERASSRSRATSRSRQASRSRDASVPPPTNDLPRADPSTPLGKMQALQSKFRTHWLPQCTKFIMSPPSDESVRQKEFLVLSESVMAQIVLKADDIDVEGNNDARNVRRNMVQEAQQVLKELDVVMKK